MKSSDQLQQSIERFRKSFWEKSSTDRPPVGIVPKDIWLPIKYCKKPLTKPELKPSRLTAELAETDYEFAFAKKRVTIDDFLPFNAPWRTVPWVEAMCGCGVHVASGSLAPKPFIRTGAELDSAPIPANAAWLDCMKVQLQLLNASLPADCFLSPTILRGPSLRDMLGDLRGIAESSRLILYVEHYFDELPAVLEKLPTEELYVILPDSYIRGNDEFESFVKSVWQVVGTRVRPGAPFRQGLFCPP